jgi:hypothetical protein
MRPSCTECLNKVGAGPEEWPPPIGQRVGRHGRSGPEAEYGLVIGCLIHKNVQ